MPPVARTIGLLVLVLIAAAAGRSAVPSAGAGADPIAERGALYEVAEVPARAESFRFGAETSSLDQKAFLDAVALARPEARRLIELIDGITEVHFGGVSSGALGVTSVRGTDISITVDLAGAYGSGAQRGVSRVVLHELGHVLDFAITGRDLDEQLDEGIPPGFPCTAGENDAGCAVREERFAESFAKWATGDIGVDLFIGYRVPPPPSLDAWGAPLAALAG